MTKTAIWAALAITGVMVWSPDRATADDPPSFEIVIKDHRFEPAELKVPAGTPISVKIRNLDSAAEEFESAALHIEKVVAAGAEATVQIRALDAGRYEFIGEFHEKTARGVLIAE